MRTMADRYMTSLGPGVVMATDQSHQRIVVRRGSKTSLLCCEDGRRSRRQEDDVHGVN